MTVTSTVAASPYKGLVPFGESDVDALFFFGREHEVEVIAANLVASRLTVLYGPTGVGKTSVLRAGVVRSLRGVAFPRAVVVFDSWVDEPAQRLVRAVADAAHVEPRESLAETLTDAGAALDGELYLVLDQLEEYFVYHGGAVEPGSFTAELADALTGRGVRANVLVCLREDALAKLDVLKTRVPALFSNYLRLDHLGREAARAAIVGPVERWNELFGSERRITVEPPLVDAVLDQAGGDRIEAPYLQLVLERLWEVERSRSSSALRLATLAELGGSASIVGDHLERALRRLSPAEQETAAALFHHLVTPSGTKIAHTLGDLARYAAADESTVRPVAERLVAERILRPAAAPPGGGPRVEIFHDVLAPAVLDWSTRFEARRDEANARRALEARHRRWVLVSVCALVALVGLTAVAVYALAQRSDARSQARHARANELVARALLLQSTDPGAALAGALEAARLESTPHTEGVLRSSLEAARLRGALPTGAPVEAVAWGAARRVAIGGADGRVLLWDATADRVVGRLDVGGPVRSVARAGAGRTLLVVGGGAARLWDTATGRMLLVARGRGRVVDAAVSPDGRVLATAAADGVVLRRTQGGRVLVRIPATGARSVAFASDARTLAVVRFVADEHVTASTYDVASGRRLAELPQPGIKDIAFAPRGDLLATAGADGRVGLWRARSGTRVAQLDDGGDAVRDVAFSPDGRFLATASSDGGVRVWRVADGSRFFLFLGHGSGVDEVVFSPDGTYLASASDDHTARIWAVDGIEAGKLVALPAGSRGPVTAEAFSPGGRSLATGGDDGVARLWDARVEQQLGVVAAEGAPVEALRALPGAGLAAVTRGSVRIRLSGGERSLPLRGPVVALSDTGSVAAASGRSVTVRALPSGGLAARLAAPERVSALAFRADGAQLTAVAGRTVLVWDVADSRVLHRLRVEPDVVAVALAPDGETVLTGDASGEARMWAVDGRMLHVLRWHRAQVTDARFDPAGARVVTVSEGVSDNAALWDVASGRLLHSLVGHFGTVTAASFSADGRWIVTAGPIAAGVWNATDGSLLFYVREPQGAALLTDAEWAPDGYRIVTSSRDGVLREYGCLLCSPPSDLEGLAQARLAAAR